MLLVKSLIKTIVNFQTLKHKLNVSTDVRIKETKITIYNFYF